LSNRSLRITSICQLVVPACIHAQPCLNIFCLLLSCLLVCHVRRCDLLLAGDALLY
jgi:hypothetical protein